PRAPHYGGRRPLKFRMIKRGVGGYYDHDRAVGIVRWPASGALLQFIFQVISTQLAAYRSPIYHQNSAEIRLNQHTNGAAAKRGRQLARRRADTTLKTEGNCARSCADRAFFHGAFTRILDRAEYI